MSINARLFLIQQNTIGRDGQANITARRRPLLTVIHQGRDDRPIHQRFAAEKIDVK